MTGPRRPRALLLTDPAGAPQPPPAGAARAKRADRDAPPAPKPERAGDDGPTIPDVLPILPLRNVVVFPLSFLPLTVGQARSIRLIDEAAVGDRVIGLVAMRDPEVEEPGPEGIHTVGTAAYIHRMVKSNDGNIGLFVQGLNRVRVEEWVGTEPYLRARVTVLGDAFEPTLEIEALMRNVSELFGRLVNLVPYLPEELLGAIQNMEDPRALAYFIAANIRMPVPEAQKFLEMESVEMRMRALVSHLSRELEVLELGRQIQQEARGEIEKVQREYFLRQQLKAIQRELGETDESLAELDQLEERIRACKMNDEAEREALRELGRLKGIPEASAEYGVIRTYLDWMVSLPWSTTTDDNLDIAHARQVLDEDHFDLDDIKARILEFLAVQKLRRERLAEGADHRAGGGILAFVGPPGVGKTSLGRSIARALGRSFIRMSLGGLRDEAEIRGHRRTYIGALPGRIIQGLKRAGTRNPVFMLDEIDKVGASFRGDPESALLEVLDPQQNREFRDLYLDVPFDLSDVLFIATGNVLGQVSGPLRDRMEIIELSGYTEHDKVHIARGFLVPRQLAENGLRPDEMAFTDDALLRVVRLYTREAGVRNLERELGKVCRKVAVRVAEGATEAVVVGADDLRGHLGAPRFESEVAERTAIPGVATGLAFTPYGGDVLFIEASAAPGAKGFIVTGQLGDVMRESAQAALSYVRARAADLGVGPDFFAGHDLHVHVPAGATPKDGPSAGVAMATALASLLTRRPVRPDVGMTGEITLRGKVLPVGGIREKVLAAHRAGLTTVILPRRNEPDLEEVPAEARARLTFVPVDTIADVWAHALTDAPPADRASD
ncbi:endopeptidase La [bacterium]|nr:MAG: endopeptidase La [bacterium]